MGLAASCAAHAGVGFTVSVAMKGFSCTGPGQRRACQVAVGRRQAKKIAWCSSWQQSELSAKVCVETLSRATHLEVAQVGHNVLRVLGLLLRVAACRARGWQRAAVSSGGQAPTAVQARLSLAPYTAAKAAGNTHPCWCVFP